MATAQQTKIANKLGIKSTTATSKHTMAFWKLTEGDVLEVTNIKFRNGEHHVHGTMNGVKVEYPEVFFNIDYL